MTILPQLSQIRHVFLDMDGTIYSGNQLFPTTLPFLDYLNSQEIGYTFITNNSSHSHAEYVAKLTRLGLRINPEQLYTSLDFALGFMQQYHPQYKSLHFFGMPLVAKEVLAAGYKLVNYPVSDNGYEHDRKSQAAQTSDSSLPDALLLAFHRDFHYHDLCAAAYLLRQGVPTIATHPDYYCPSPEPTWLVDCGAIVECLQSATGKLITVLGKPHPQLLILAATKLGFQTSQVMMVGDRLATDIALGCGAGALTCHIYHPGGDLKRPEGVVPDITVNNLGELQKILIQNR